MKTSDFYFDLPEELIAQVPILDRSSSKLMVLDKETGEIEHKTFKNVIDYINPGDCLVLNNTRVIPARLIGEKVDTGGKIEFLLLKRTEEDTWQALVKPGKRAKIGTKFSFGNGKLIGEVVGLAEEGSRIIKFHYEGIFEEVLDELGNMPLPPYITERLEERERYQTVYSKHNGSAAAPTAGLHFTEELLQQIKDKGVEIAFVTLHVGLGTFRPVKVDDVLEHEMHSEYYMVDKEAAQKINNAKKNGHNVVCVGTTSCRTVESATNEEGIIEEASGWTNIFIYPGYKFKMVDKLITNFHLPESTLIMLVSALSSKENVLNAYEIAVFLGTIDVLRMIWTAYIVEYHTPVAYSQLNDILAQILLLVIAIEFVVMLSLHIPGTIIEVLLYAIARKMLLLPKSGGMLEVLLGVIAIAGLFTIRKYLLTKDNSNMNITSIHYDRDDDDIIDAKDPI